MTSSKLDDLHPYDSEIDKTFHRLSRNNRSISVVVHDCVVLDNSVVHTEFIVDYIFIMFLSLFLLLLIMKKNSVDIMANNN